MKDRIITIVAILAFILTIIFMINGIKIGNIQISSIKQIIQKNEETNKKIEEVAKITNIDYEAATQNIEKTAKDLKNSEKKYYDLLDNIELQENNYFQFVHIEGGHLPYDLNENVDTIENGTYDDKLLATITIIDKYLTKNRILD